MVLRNIAKKGFYERLSQFGLEARWKKQHSKVRISNILSKEKVSINAYLCGDGWIKIRRENKRKNAVHYEIRIFLDNFELSKKVVSMFVKEYNIEPKIRNLKGYYNIEIKSKPVCLDLLKLGKYDSLNWNIPKNISLDLTKEWIKCFFDCEAYVSNYSCNIQVKSINRNGLISIMNELTKFGIISKVYGPYRQIKDWHSDYSVLIVPKKGGNLDKYEKLISFNHPDKKYKIQRLLQ